MTTETIQAQQTDIADLWQYVERTKPQIEDALQKFLPLAPAEVETEFGAAVEYALFSGEKRLRPVLTLLGAELIGGDAAKVLPAAVAVEFIYTSSQIFDRLPFMQNAPPRRGKKSLPELYGEGLSLLVGVAFLNAAYGLVFVNHAAQPERAIAAHAEIVECVGAGAVIGGQTSRLPSREKNASAPKNFADESIRNLKTSALMRLALRVGAILAGADFVELNTLSRFAEIFGDAYQLSDDLLSLEKDDSIFAEQNKTVALQNGADSARQQLKMLTEEAKRVLIENFPPSKARSCLVQLTEYLAERNV
jgi:geranylgeranyl diphosphate synthase, type II